MAPQPADYLQADRFMRSAVESRALLSAIRGGLIRRILERDGTDEADAAAVLRCPGFGGTAVLALLAQAGVTRQDAHGRSTLTAEFTRALPYLDLIETKLDLAVAVASDFFENFDLFLRSPEDFQHRARLFEIFNYGDCLSTAPLALAGAAKWVKYTTMLTRYEAAACASRYEFGRHHRMLDLGGNSGEFGIQLARRHEDLQVLVADLPAVCEIGRRHVDAQGLGGRIGFLDWDLRTGDLPRGFDLITFKSLLHDWPDATVVSLLAKARQALAPGGSVLIFERQRWNLAERPWGFGDLPVLLFYHCYRQAEQYRGWLAQAGFTDICLRFVPLEVDFMLIDAR